MPGPSDLLTDVYVNNTDHYIRGVEYSQSHFPGGRAY